VDFDLEEAVSTETRTNGSPAFRKADLRSPINVIEAATTKAASKGTRTCSNVAVWPVCWQAASSHEMALPREVCESNDFNVLPKSLGKTCLIDLHGVSA
jgi:hypothetical protein